MEATLVFLGLIAAGMGWVTATLVKWAWEARTPTSAGVVLFLQGMMVAMLGGAAVYYLHPSGASLVEGLWLASAAMSLSVFPLFLLVLREVRRGRAEGNDALGGPLAHRRAFAFSVALLILVGEFLMGWTFQIAAQGPGAPPWGSWAAAVAYGVDSPWFLFPMALEMALTTLYLRVRVGRTVLGVFGSQAAMMAFSPPALSWGDWVPVSALIGSGLMFAVYAFPMADIYRRETVTPALVAYLLVLVPVFGAMLAGLVIWVVSGQGWLFALAILAQMFVFFDAVIFSDRFAREAQPPSERAKATPS